METTRHSEQDKLRHNLGRFCEDETANRIACGVPLGPDASDSEKAVWVKHIVDALDKRFDEKTIQTIRAACHCTEEGRMGEMKAWLGGLYAESDNLEDFVDKVNAFGAGWEMRDGAIDTRFLTCECYMVQGVERLDSKTWCYCTMGYTKALFEHVFGCEVEAELIQSIKMGSPYCIVRIRKKS